MIDELLGCLVVELLVFDEKDDNFFLIIVNEVNYENLNFVCSRRGNII